MNQEEGSSDTESTSALILDFPRLHSYDKFPLFIRPLRYDIFVMAAQTKIPQTHV